MTKLTIFHANHFCAVARQNLIVEKSTLYTRTFLFPVGMCRVSFDGKGKIARKLLPLVNILQRSRSSNWIPRGYSYALHWMKATPPFPTCKCVYLIKVFFSSTNCYQFVIIIKFESWNFVKWPNDEEVSEKLWRQN